MPGRSSTSGSDLADQRPGLSSPRVTAKGKGVLAAFSGCSGLRHRCADEQLVANAYFDATISQCPHEQALDRNTTSHRDSSVHFQSLPRELVLLGIQ